MQDNDGTGAASRVRPVALALIEMNGTGALALAPLPEDGPSALERLLGTVREVGWVKRAVVLCDASDEAVFTEAQRLGAESLQGQRGPAESLRTLDAPPDQVVLRLSTRCPLLCSEVVSAAVDALLGGGHDHVSTDLGSGVLPAGLDVEACRAAWLYAAAEEGALLSTQRQRSHELSPAELGPVLERSGRYYASFRLLLEGPEDLPLLRAVASLLRRQPEPRALHTLLRLLDLHPEWRSAIRDVLQLRPPAAAVLG